MVVCLMFLVFSWGVLFQPEGFVSELGVGLGYGVSDSVFSDFGMQDLGLKSESCCTLFRIPFFQLPSASCVKIMLLQTSGSNP